MLKCGDSFTQDFNAFEQIGVLCKGFNRFAVVIKSQTERGFGIHLTEVEGLFSLYKLYGYCINILRGNNTFPVGGDGNSNI